MPTDISPKMLEESCAIVQEIRRKLQKNPEDADLKRMHETAMENHRGLATAQTAQLQDMCLQRIISGMVR